MELSKTKKSGNTCWPYTPRSVSCNESWWRHNSNRSRWWNITFLEYLSRKWTKWRKRVWYEWGTASALSMQYDNVDRVYDANINVWMSVVEIEFMLALAVPADCSVQNRSDTFAFVLPTWNVGLRDLPHEGLIHQCHCALRSRFSFSHLHWTISFRCCTLFTLFLPHFSLFLTIPLLRLIERSSKRCSRRGGWPSPSSSNGLVEFISKGTLINVI